tara:strand:- start:9677 stop:9886 length:210 start_codon:yes stop_codon:yes gene_type:complete
MATVAERIHQYLVDEAPALCDDCIAEALEITNRHQVQPVTSALGATPQFHRYQSECYGCDREKLVIEKA